MRVALEVSSTERSCPVPELSLSLHTSLAGGPLVSALLLQVRLLWELW